MTGAVLSFFAVLGIFCFPVLLKFDHPLNLLIGLDLFFGVVCIFFLHLIRLDDPAKVCSGEYLTESEKATAQGYLLERGGLLYSYMKGFWITLSIIAIIIITVVILVIKSIK